MNFFAQAFFIVSLELLWTVNKPLASKSQQFDEKGCCSHEQVFTACEIVTVFITPMSSTNQRMTVNLLAFRRRFNLVIWKDTSVFSSKTKVSVKSEASTKTFEVSSNLLVGHGVDEYNKQVWCQGTIFGGIFDGVIHADDETYYVEPAYRYCHGSSKARNKSIVYRKADVNLKYVSLPKFVPFSFSKQGCDTQDCFLPVFAQRTAGRPNPSPHTGSNTPLSCSLKLVADHLFFQHVGSSSVTQTLSEIALLVREADSVFRSTDINGDGTSDNLGFAIQDITIYTDENVQGYILGDIPLDEGEYLESFSEYDFSQFCLALAFTYRDFSNGIVGLAWVASSSTYSFPGGICQPRIHWISKGKSYSFNTAIVTSLNHGTRVPRSESISTVIHELGHSFGSPHDMESNKACAPGDYQGNFIMYPYSSDGTKPNNYKFSPCSLASINPVLVNKGNCLVNHPGPICGNGLVEFGEECDCGTTPTCFLIDQCCTPSDVPVSSVDRPCTVRREAGYLCSPRVSSCCNQSCQLQPDLYICSQGTDCRYTAYCDGTSPACPAGHPKPNGTLCSDANMYCYLGTCQVSLCRVYGLEDCMCSGENQMCNICCKTDLGDCQRIGMLVSVLNSTLFNVMPGQPCNSYNGYCDKNGDCIMIGSDSSFERLTDMFGADTANGVKEWLLSNWFYVVLGVLCLFLLVMLFWTNVKCYQNTTVIAKRTGKLMQLISEAQSQKERITQKLAQYRSMLEDNDNGACTSKKLDRVVAVSRLLMLFPTLSREEVNKVAGHVTSEEMAVRYLLLRGYPLVSIVRYRVK